eukprot:763837-Hanusia_phi.AAC.9
MAGHESDFKARLTELHQEMIRLRTSTQASFRVSGFSFRAVKVDSQAARDLFDLKLYALCRSIS